MADVTALQALDRRVRRLAPARRLRFLLVEEALDRFAAGRSLRVLDAGCGEGFFTIALARRHPAWTVVGADYEPDLVERARSNALAAGVINVEVIQADVTEDLGRDRYDAVVAIECLEEIANDTRALECMIAALRPGGLLVAHVPESNWRPVFRRSEATWRAEVRHGYDATELDERLTALRLEHVEVRGTSRNVVRAAQELRDRLRDLPLPFRAALAPVLVAAVELERHGVTWGPERALIARGVRATSA